MKCSSGKRQDKTKLVAKQDKIKTQITRSKFRI